VIFHNLLKALVVFCHHLQPLLSQQRSIIGSTHFLSDIPSQQFQLECRQPGILPSHLGPPCPLAAGFDALRHIGKPVHVLGWLEGW
jgi:hypothetical protein